MTQYNSVNVKLSDLPRDKLKSATKNSTGVALKLTSNMNDTSANEIKFSHEWSPTYRQVTRFCNAFTYYSSADIKLLKTEIWKIIHLAGFFSGLFRSMTKIELPLAKIVVTLLTKMYLCY